jgi:DnaK suppressor protein
MTSVPVFTPDRLSDHALQRLRAALFAARDNEVARLAHASSSGGGTVNDEHTEISAASSSTALLNIERALDRLASGTYGSCESCGQAIAVDRLEAIPYTTTCFACAVTR